MLSATVILTKVSYVSLVFPSISFARGLAKDRCKGI